MTAPRSYFGLKGRAPSAQPIGLVTWRNPIAAGRAALRETSSRNAAFH